jgi:hypothetical protein
MVAVAGVIAAVAVVAVNIDHILTFGAKWLGPYIKAYTSPRADIFVLLGGDLDISADVFVADPANETHVIAVSRTQRGEQAVLRVPANTVYTIGWQGPGLEAGAAQHVLAVEGKTLFRLERIGESPGQIKVSLRVAGPDQTELPVTEPTAKLLLSASAAQRLDSSATIASGALPELDRAVAIVGLFETGTTDCARRLFFVPGVGGKKLPAVGCLAVSIPGWLSNVIVAIDGGDARHLDAFLGENADPIRNYAKDWNALPEETLLRKAMQDLIAAPEFWIAYQAHVLSVYSHAANEARKVGLVSERGRLLVFDGLVNVGPNHVSNAVRRYGEKYPEGIPGRPSSESERIHALGDILKSEMPSAFARQYARRVDTIVSGHGSIRGITFDLDQLDVSSTS